MIELNKTVTIKQFVEFSDRLDELKSRKPNPIRSNYESVKLAIDSGILIGGSPEDVDGMKPKEVMQIARTLIAYYLDQVTVTEEKAKN